MWPFVDYSGLRTVSKANEVVKPGLIEREYMTGQLLFDTCETCELPYALVDWRVLDISSEQSHSYNHGASELLSQYGGI